MFSTYTDILLKIYNKTFTKKLYVYIFVSSCYATRYNTIPCKTVVDPQGQ